LRCLRKEKGKVRSRPQIIFEDQVLLILDKPAGLVVNRAATVKTETLQDWLEKKKLIDPKQKKEAPAFGQRLGIVHRLDKETSGLLIVAKTPQAWRNLQKQFKERQVKKRYWALVHGQVTPPQGEISASISRHPFDRQKFGVFLGGRPAKTSYRTLKNYETKEWGKFSLLELSPKTGRTHQLRVHLKYLGYPVVGDQKYAGRKRFRVDRKWCPRQFLHASFLAFAHPLTGQRVEFSSPLPADLKKALQTLQ